MKNSHVKRSSYKTLRQRNEIKYLITLFFHNLIKQMTDLLLVDEFERYLRVANRSRRRPQRLLDIVNQTLVTTPLTQQTLDKSLFGIEFLVKHNNFIKVCDVRVPVLIFARRFVSLHGLIEPMKFSLFLYVATLVALKMFEEEGLQCTDYRLSAEKIGIALKDLLRLELELLVGLKFHLFIDQLEWDEQTKLLL